MTIGARTNAKGSAGVLPTTFREENVTLRNTATTHSPGKQTTHHSPTRLESPDKFSPPPCAQTCNGYLHNNRSPSLGCNLDPTLHALDDMSSSVFAPTILSHDAPPHFTLLEFQMYNDLQDPFDHQMRSRQCDAPFPRGPLTTRQPAEYSWMSGNPTPLMKIG